MNDHGRLISYREAADLIGVTHTTVSRLVADGFLVPRYLGKSQRPRLVTGEVVEYRDGLPKVPFGLESLATLAHSQESN